MRFLGFQEEAVATNGQPCTEEIVAGLRDEDAGLYERLVEHWIAGQPHLEPYREGLQSGGTVVVLTGQQPALLGGPLYTLYKTLTAVVAAARLRAVGRSAVAAFWCVGDDTDHDEVATASWPRHRDVPARVRDEVPAGRERIGGLSVERMRPALERLRGDWPRAALVTTLLEQIASASAREGWSGFLRRSLLALVGNEPFLFVDGNDPVVVTASQRFLRRFVAEREGLAEEIDAQVRPMLASGEPPALSGTQARRCLFVADGATRRPLEDAELPAPSTDLLPNVVLRPALQEHLLPVHRVVCGQAELAYRRLLGPVYARLARPAAALMPRFSATLFPGIWATDPDAPDPAMVLRNPDAAVEQWTRVQRDLALVTRVENLRRRMEGDLRSLEPALRKFDRSLPQVLDSVAGKIDFQVRRLGDAVAAKGRHAWLSDRPELVHLRENLLPRGKSQERSFTIWTPLLYEGGSVLGELRDAVERWFERGESGHALLSVGHVGG